MEKYETPFRCHLCGASSTVTTWRHTELVNKAAVRMVHWCHACFNSREKVPGNGNK